MCYVSKNIILLGIIFSMRLMIFFLQSVQRELVVYRVYSFTYRRRRYTGGLL